MQRPGDWTRRVTVQAGEIGSDSDSDSDKAILYYTKFDVYYLEFRGRIRECPADHRAAAPRPAEGRGSRG